MTTASDNVFPKIILSEVSAPSTPSSGQAKLYVKSDGLLYWKDDSGTEHAAGGGGGGTTYGQAVPYPTSFSGDTIDGSSTSPYVDVAAFDTKEVLNSRILHLRSQGASKDHRVRVTLGTTKAGAFDVRVALQPMNNWWAAFLDTYTEIRLSTSADAQLAIARIGAGYSGANSSPFAFEQQLRVGGSSITSLDDNIEPKFQIGQAVTIRFVRDGSNNITFYYAAGQAPLALNQVVEKASGTYGAPESVSVSGTLARIEIAHHTPSGPASTFQVDTYLDYLASV